MAAPSIMSTEGAGLSSDVSVIFSMQGIKSLFEPCLILPPSDKDGGDP